MTTPPPSAGLPSDKLIPPLNAPRAGAVTVGIQPGSQGPILAQYVVVFGTSGGVFIYAGSPALGNPPVYWMGNVVADPYGNPLDQGIWAGQPGSNQVGIQSSAGLARIYFVPTGNYQADASVGMVQTGGQAILEIFGAQTTANPAANSDRVGLFLYDHGVGGSAALQMGYYDTTNGFHEVFVGNYQGLNIPLLYEALAIDPTTGTSPSNVAVSEGYHPINLDPGWSITPTHDQPAYRLLPDGHGGNANIQFTGSANFSGTPGVPQALNANNPISIPAYIPGNNHYWRSGDSHRMGAEYTPGGVINCYPVTGGANTVALDGIVSLR